MYRHTESCTPLRAIACILAVASIISCDTRGPATGTDLPNVPSADGARAVAMQLGSRLKARLHAAIATDGPIAAIEVCAVEAPRIAAEISASTGFDVGRTALRVRNPSNAPDARERAVLEAWIASIEAGTPAAELGAYVEEDESFLWMKPIVTEPVCLACHGKAVPEAVAAAIAERYPGDRATGFEAGDLRGAFVVRRGGR